MTIDELVGWEEGRAVTLTVNGEFDFDQWRRPQPGDSRIRIPTLRRSVLPSRGGGAVLDEGAVCRIYIYAGSPFAQLPIGTKLLFSTLASTDASQLPGVDKKTLIWGLPLSTPFLFVASDDGVTISPADGQSLLTDYPWTSVTLTKTGSASWAASGDFVST